MWPKIRNPEAPRERTHSNGQKREKKRLSLTVLVSSACFSASGSNFEQMAPLSCISLVLSRSQERQQLCPRLLAYMLSSYLERTVNRRFIWCYGWPNANELNSDVPLCRALSSFQTAKKGERNHVFRLSHLQYATIPRSLLSNASGETLRVPKCWLRSNFWIVSSFFIFFPLNSLRSKGGQLWYWRLLLSTSVNRIIPLRKDNGD